MPTGYTAGIVDGKTKTFKEFAKQCMRAFGAAIHMRDEPFDKPYEHRKPDDYHLKQINEYEKQKAKVLKMDVLEITLQTKKELEEQKERVTQKIAEINAIGKRLNQFLDEANKWQPPTDQHKGIKDFMVKQISETIDWDADPKYHEDELKRIEEELKHIDPIAKRNEMIEAIDHDISYHTKQYAEEVQRCKESNEWAETFVKSLN